MKTKEQRGQEIMDAIRSVLVNDWDPIGIKGIGPNDEYDGYIGQVYRLLSKSPTEEDVARQLLMFESHDIGLPKRETGILDVARKLLSIDVSMNERGASNKEPEATR
ncbi:MAG: hypothetical protein GX748_17395 [Lentisphaerae bacterium]|nr:hypothetical protein [Lentisphaerota bacterium]